MREYIVPDFFDMGECYIKRWKYTKEGNDYEDNKTRYLLKSINPTERQWHDKSDNWHQTMWKVFFIV